ncbi:flagellar protein FlgN [Roseibium salinum]|uniref:Flagellar protein FlgN n=1 Tax=Roseibium salinum TaxID=1604349 RepID=A0ABT3QYS1_9HYPH|nr:flagellar protein FlgN [Roseibium sp. DSM 29163]MCX2722050.1 flagellar protein FlgN [Roseibium sp. DSM 29163]MDN3719935.1 flagellar protein FlgN [Roseibium salinum]
MTAQPNTNTFPFSLERPASRQEAEEFCSALSGTMEALLSVIEMETELVRAGKLKQAGELQPDKARLIHEYTRGMMTAKEHAVALGNLAPAATQSLRRQHGEFQPVLRINLAVLSTARDVAGSIVSAVAKVAGAKNATAPTTYGRNGSAPSGPQSARGIAVNRAL